VCFIAWHVARALEQLCWHLNAVVGSCSPHLEPSQQFSLCPPCKSAVATVAIIQLSAVQSRRTVHAPTAARWGMQVQRALQLRDAAHQQQLEAMQRSLAEQGDSQRLQATTLLQGQMREQAELYDARLQELSSRHEQVCHHACPEDVLDQPGFGGLCCTRTCAIGVLVWRVRHDWAALCEEVCMSCDCCCQGMRAATMRHYSPPQ
jgi:hypothetical protein